MPEFASELNWAGYVENTMSDGVGSRSMVNLHSSEYTRVDDADFPTLPRISALGKSDLIVSDDRVCV